jgi:hypothetical protein
MNHAMATGQRLEWVKPRSLPTLTTFRISRGPLLRVPQERPKKFCIISPIRKNIEFCGQYWPSLPQAIPYANAFR